METKSKKELLDACDTLQSQFETIVNKMLFDASQNHMDLDVNMMKKKDSDRFSFTVIFPNTGICRSRPAFFAAVDAAANAIWEEAYHYLFGDEASAFIPEEIIMDQARAMQWQQMQLGGSKN